jgi:hypothetical protein
MTMQVVREDWLGRLPDDILVNILERLNVWEAARTSVLARRWLHLPDMLSHLTIDVGDFVPDYTCLEEEIVRCNARIAASVGSTPRPSAFGLGWRILL